MTVTGMDVFDTTVHKTNRWLHLLMERLEWSDRHRAYLALRATLHALRDRLPIAQVAQLGAQLPMLVRGFYYEGWDPTHKPIRERHRIEFLLRIEQEFRSDPTIDPERIASAVFAVMAERVSEGEIEDVKSVLPGEIKDLWPRPAPRE